MPVTEVTIPTLFSTLAAYQRSGAFKAAIDLDLFTAIAEGNDSTAALATRCNAAERGIRILCDTLAAMGLLIKRDGRYGLAPGGEDFLDRRSPAYVGSAATFVASPQLMEPFMRVADAVRRGGTVVPDDGTLAAEHPIWVEFARAMGPLAALTARLLANLLSADTAPPWKVLDIAAGHGEFGVALARANPKAQIVALDWSNVLAVAEETARKAGIIDRFRKLPGSALEVDYGEGYDLVLLTNFLHHFDRAGCETVLKKVHRALKPGGRAVTVEFVPNEDRVSPPEAAGFSLVMLVLTPGGDAYTFRELDQMMRSAGFAKNELHELPPSFHRVVISTK
jgi:ubiquinone/menaquinone biosynthesis C-methylase UbiE/predicted transcriptional regulator